MRRRNRVIRAFPNTSVNRTPPTTKITSVVYAMNTVNAIVAGQVRFIRMGVTGRRVWAGGDTSR
jgi:hypothetical protein